MTDIPMGRWVEGGSIGDRVPAHGMAIALSKGEGSVGAESIAVVLEVEVVPGCNVNVVATLSLEEAAEMRDKFDLAVECLRHGIEPQIGGQS